MSNWQGCEYWGALVTAITELQEYGAESGEEVNRNIGEAVAREAVEMLTRGIDAALYGLPVIYHNAGQWVERRATIGHPAYSPTGAPCGASYVKWVC